MGPKGWLKRRKRKRLTGVEALDHGIVRGDGIPYPDRWKQKDEIKYWAPMREKEAYRFYMSLPAVKENPRLATVTAFARWNAKRKKLLETAEADFKQIEGINPSCVLSQAQRNKLGEHTRQRMNQINDGLESRI